MSFYLYLLKIKYLYCQLFFQVLYVLKINIYRLTYVILVLGCSLNVFGEFINGKFLMKVIILVRSFMFGILYLIQNWKLGWNMKFLN